MSGDLQGKVAVVTGGASGIGKATVELFVKEGAKVVIADMQEEKGAALAERLGPAARFKNTDVSKAESVAELVDFTVATFAGLDVFYSNAGVSGGEGDVFLENDFSCFDKVMAIDLLGPMLGAKYAARYMKDHGGGSIINTASIAASYSGYGVPEYRAAKAGVLALTKSLAIELGEYGIRVNAVSPGPTKTEMVAMEGSVPQEKLEQIVEASLGAMLGMQVLQRVGLPEDIAQAALFLASDRSAQVTGLDLIVDGGASLGDKVDRQALMKAEMAKVLAG